MLKVTQNLMLPTAITGSYPRPLWFTESLHDGRSSRRSATRSFASSISTRSRASSTLRKPPGSTS